MSSFGALVARGTSALQGLTGGVDELARQAAADDGRYYQDIISFFELVLPRGPSFLFPLIHAPQQYALDEPFAVELTHTDYAGLWAEQSGIVERSIRLVGHTGFRPQAMALPGPVPAAQTNLPKNYTPRFLQPQITSAISGQKIYEYLNESLFRAYSDHLRDPATAGGTQLLFHNPRDGEHWRVAPLRFSLGRGPANTYTYPYTIDLAVLGPAQATVLPLPAGDASLLARLRDTVATVKAALGGLTAAVDDLTRLEGTFTVFGQQVASVVDAGATLARAAASFVEGGTQLINVPLASVFALFNACRAICELYAALADAGQSLADWPPTVLARFRAMQNACDQLATQPGAFQPPLDARLARLGTSAALPTPQVVAATSVAQAAALGTADLPGEAALAPALPTAATPTYRSVRQVAARQGDTLARVAARELGDSGAWRDLAALNQLGAPLAPAAGTAALASLPTLGATGALAAGQTLLVPSPQPPPAVATNPAVLGAQTTDAPSAQLLGRDLALAPVGAVGAPTYDLVWTAAGGGEDLATVEGVDNLGQAMEQTVATAQGEAPLYPDFGLQGYVGTGISSADVAMRNYRLAAAMRADPRVASVGALTSSQAADAWAIDATVVAVGQSQALALRLTVF